MNGGLLMQYLKPEVRERIIKVATKEFMQKGFMDVNMRHLAKLSGITVGNIYRYFPSKERLLDQILEEPSQQLIDLIAKTDYEIVGITIDERFNYSIKSLLKICEAYSTTVLILLTKVKGSKYEKVYHQVQAAVLERIKYEFKQIDDDLAEAITVATLASVVHILSKYHEQPKKLSLGLNKVIGYLFYQLDQRIAGKEN
jgi:AcrR family transcriptional regulator